MSLKQKFSRAKRIRRQSFRGISRFFRSLGLALWLVAAAPRLALAQGLGNLGQNVAQNFTGVAKAIQMFGFLAGLTLVVMGLMELYNMNKRPDATLPGAMTKCAIGAALLAVDALISSFSTTIFGGDKSGSNLGTLGL
jgi:hypothetical protein